MMGRITLNLRKNMVLPDNDSTSMLDTGPFQQPPLQSCGTGARHIPREPLTANRRLNESRDLEGYVLDIIPENTQDTECKEDG